MTWQLIFFTVYEITINVIVQNNGKALFQIHNLINLINMTYSV